MELWSKCDRKIFQKCCLIWSFLICMAHASSSSSFFCIVGGNGAVGGSGGGGGNGEAHL